MNISISNGNSKMGEIRNVSLPAGLTCGNYPCREKCYALRMERRYPTVREAYQKNYDVLQSDPDTYWREVEGSIMLSRFFRFHVSGDIPDATYLRRMVEVAERNRHCEILCFTKRYDLVNSFLQSGHGFPKNLHIIFSVWVGLEMANPFLLPEAHVIYRDGTTTARPDAKVCEGNCAECAITGEGCWTLQRGEQVVFHEH